MYGAGHWRDSITVAQGASISREVRLFMRRDDNTEPVWVDGKTLPLSSAR
jgi:hypothetical protein